MGKSGRPSEGKVKEHLFVITQKDEREIRVQSDHAAI